MQNVSEMQLYFKGERDIGITVIVIGVIMAGVLICLWKSYREPLGYGLMIPAGLLMIVGMAVGPALIFSSNQRIHTYSQQIQTDKSAFLRIEKPRMERVNANWIRLKRCIANSLVFQHTCLMATDLSIPSAVGTEYIVAFRKSIASMEIQNPKQTNDMHRGENQHDVSNAL